MGIFSVIMYPRLKGGNVAVMKRIKWYLFLVVLSFFCVQGTGQAETMYVTDQLFLSLRSAPDPEQPAMELLRSDTKADVLRTEGDWAEVRLEDGRSGWVMKRFLVEDLPKSLIIEELKGQLKDEDLVLERLRQENASLKKQIADRATLEAKEVALKRRMGTLENQIAQQTQRLEMTTRENAQKRLKGISVTAVMALFVGSMIGYLVGRQKKKQPSSSYL
jgi:SH3 domain protein